MPNNKEQICVLFNPDVVIQLRKIADDVAKREREKPNVSLIIRAAVNEYLRNYYPDENPGEEERPNE